MSQSSIVKIDTRTFANTTFGYSDKIRIPIQQQDLYTSHGNFLYIKLTIKKPVAESDVALRNNCDAFMFNKIRYELDGVESIIKTLV